MLRGESIRGIINRGGQRDVGGAVRYFYNRLGLADEAGNRYETPTGEPDWAKVVEARSKGGYLPQEVSLSELANAFCGEQWVKNLNPENKVRGLNVQMAQLMEAGTGAVAPGDFINVSGLTAVTTGLLEVAVMEGFNRLGFISDKIAPVDPTKVFGGRKVIGAGGIGNAAEVRKPGMPTKRAGLTERWINTPQTEERAAGIEILNETIYLDLFGKCLEEANDIGYWIHYGKDLRCIDCFIGVSTATQYNYKGTTYSTYLAAGYYDNDFSNELVHESNVESALIKFRDMLDPETNTRVTINPNLMVVNRGKLRTAQAICGDLAIGVEYRDTGSAPSIRTSQPAYRSRFEIIESPLLYERCTAANGLALSATNAEKYWWLVDTTGSGHVRYAQNWPLRVQTVAPTNIDMVDRGVQLFIKADERGEPYVRDARKAVRNKN